MNTSLSLLQRHPQVEETTRCVTSRLKEETQQVLVIFRDPLPPHLSLGSWGTYYLRPYTPEPLWCFRCHSFRHHQASCTRLPVCGICSGHHETNTCLAKYKAKEAVTHKCPNCFGQHHAWNPSCPARLQRVNQGRERQVAWVQQQQRTTSSPVPPGTFVWGQQRRTSSLAPSAPLQLPRTSLLYIQSRPRFLRHTTPAHTHPLSPQLLQYPLHNPPHHRSHSNSLLPTSAPSGRSWPLPPPGH